MARRYPTGEQQPWVEPLAVFSEAYNAVFVQVHQLGRFRMISPDTGSIDGLVLFVKLYDSLIENYPL